MPQTSQKEKTYNKRIDELIEDAEIEAEIEAEKKFRSKNTRIWTISLIAVALIAFIFLEIKTGSKATSPEDNSAVALPELATGPVPAPTQDSQPPATPPEQAPQAPNDETSIQVPKEENPLQGVTSTEPKSSETVAAIQKSEAKKTESTVPVENAETETPQPAAPVEKPPVVAKAPPKEPAPPIIEKTRAAKIIKPSRKLSPQNVASAKQYHVQMGVFSVEENAKNFAKSLRAKGFNPSIQVRSLRANRHVVYVGGFFGEAEGARARAELKAGGFAPVMENFEGNPHTLVLGKFKNPSQAEALRDKLSTQGFLSSTKKSRVQANIHTVQLGPFASLPQAKKAQKNIDRAGFGNSFIR